MSKQFKPMLAGKAPDTSEIRFPIMVSAKLDGVRCIVINGVAMSRSLKPIPNKYVQSVLSHGFNNLDGELIIGETTDNIAFGMGGALLQHMNRDTMRFAQKASSITIKGEDRQIFKDPVTDKGKASKKGRQMLYKNTAGEYYTSEIDSALKAFEQLEVVYQNGLLLRKQTLDNIRSIANG